MTDPTGEDIRRNRAIVQEILDLTGNVIKQQGDPKDENTKALRALTVANQTVCKVVLAYYDAHPFTTNLGELRKLVMETYLAELRLWSKDDLLFMLCLQQTKLAMEHFGY